MIERIKWPDPRRGELECPFLRGTGERPLRLTFHSPTLHDLPAGEAEAFEALRDLAHNPLIEAAQMEQGEFPQIKIESGYDSSDAYLVGILGQGGVWEQGFRYLDKREELGGIVARIADQADQHNADAQVVSRDLLDARMHVAMGRDIFVTTSRSLIRNRAVSEVLAANPRTPSEAARILGLFLRSRDDYSFQTFASALPQIQNFGWPRYYDALVRQRLPSISRYLIAIGRSQNTSGTRDGRYALAASVLTRCIRAIQARDAIGMQYFIPKYTITQERMLYHFDYLTLLLSGALDAEARVTYRVYGISRPRERNVSFQNPEFQTELQNAGANRIHALITGQRFKDMQTLLHYLRNTIHHQALRGHGMGTWAQLNAVAVEVPDDDAPEMWSAATRLGSAVHWGLHRRRYGNGTYYYEMEPYAYARTLVERCFSLINDVAARTAVVHPDTSNREVIRLSRRGFLPPAVRRRLIILGW